MECNFTVGQKVVCIYNEPWPSTWNQVPNKPEFNKIYSIRNIDMRLYRKNFDDIQISKYPSVLLKEITNPPVQIDLERTMGEPSFPHYIFRPLQEKKKDDKARKEIFKPLLNPDSGLKKEFQKELEKEKV